MYGISNLFAMNPGVSREVEVYLPIAAARLRYSVICTFEWFSKSQLMFAALESLRLASLLALGS